MVSFSTSTDVDLYSGFDEILVDVVEGVHSAIESDVIRSLRDLVIPAFDGAFDKGGVSFDFYFDLTVLDYSFSSDEFRVELRSNYSDRIGVIETSVTLFPDDSSIPIMDGIVQIDITDIIFTDGKIEYSVNIDTQDFISAMVSEE